MLEGDALASWLNARAGKLTASRMADAMAFRKDGKPSADRVRLIKEILAERLADCTTRHFVSDAMKWGLEQEDDAKGAYEAETGTMIAECGFVDHPRIDAFGATPDGVLHGGGLIEVKCPTTTTMVDWMLAGVVPDEHKPQMLAQLACTGRQWCEFVAFDPRIRDPRRRLFIRRYEPTPEDIAGIEVVAAAFLAEVDAMWEVLTTGARR